MKILIQGYYGFGNLGDDILMKVTFWIVKERFPQSEFEIIVAMSYLTQHCNDKMHSAFPVFKKQNPNGMPGSLWLKKR